MNVERQFNGFVKYIDSTHYAYILPEGEDFGSYPQTKVEYFKKYGFKITPRIVFQRSYEGGPKQYEYNIDIEKNTSL